jgi:hypothetical protein
VECITRNTKYITRLRINVTLGKYPDKPGIPVNNMANIIDINSRDWTFDIIKG